MTTRKCAYTLDQIKKYDEAAVMPDNSKLAVRTSKELSDKLRECLEAAKGFGNSTFAPVPFGTVQQLIELLTPAHETLYVGCPVTYSPLYPSQMPRDGWTIDRLPPELTHIIRHSSGSVIAVTAREIQPAQKAVDQRAIDANALADAHRMYEAEHGHPFSESERDQHAKE